MMTMTLPELQDTTVAAPTAAWLQSSVQKFFSGFNWEDNPPEVQEIKRISQDSDVPLSLTLSVCQFFASVNWEGTTIAAATPIQPINSSPVRNDLTLDDFSDLF